ncbi:MAG: hypothetical protein HYU84_15120 [Chloroflexi bacterium]|nr:hypothetical protein [Chloroflexota bacterium]
MKNNSLTDVTHLRFDYERDEHPLSAHIVPVYFGSAAAVLPAPCAGTRERSDE